MANFCPFCGLDNFQRCECDRPAKLLALGTAKRVDISFPHSLDFVAIFEAVGHNRASDTHPCEILNGWIILFRPDNRPFDDGDILNVHRALESLHARPGPALLIQDTDDAV